ncbi:MAG: transcription elongation factor GreA [Gammaproteobacteria bacterium]|nr:transcription elongation factor GreA [Gammaproteobacteria bacterium]
MNRVPMTIEGAEALRVELEDLKKVQRPAVVQAIAEARAHGDLKENAEYHAAREKQGFIEARIRDIESKLSFAQVIDVKSIDPMDKVIFGSTVSIIKLENDEEVSYKIVGDDEADVKLMKISVNSPIARALIGKEVGDIAEVQTPSGTVEYEIDAVRHL